MGATTAVTAAAVVVVMTMMVAVMAAAAAAAAAVVVVVVVVAAAVAICRSFHSPHCRSCEVTSLCALPGTGMANALASEHY